MRIRFKAPPRTKQPPLLIFILVLIFPPRIAACEESVNRSLVCAPSPHWDYTYFSIHQSARTIFHTFSRFSALFHPKTGYIFFSKAEVLLLLLLCCLRFLLLLLLLPLLLLPLLLLPVDDGDDDDGLFFPPRAHVTSEEHDASSDNCVLPSLPCTHSCRITHFSL